jgi:S-phase kinase-associated protein 1
MSYSFVVSDSEGDHKFKVSSLEKFTKCKLVAEALQDADEDEDHEVPLVGIEPRILEKIIECMEHDDVMPEIQKPLKSNKLIENGVPKWFVDYIEAFDNKDLEKIIVAANYLDYKELLELGCVRVASMIKGKTPDEIKKIFGLVAEETEEAVVEAEGNQEAHGSDTLETVEA